MSRKLQGLVDLTKHIGYMEQNGTTLKHVTRQYRSANMTTLKRVTGQHRST
ncbi:hypothetical protein ES319_A03G060800v1 [Gossypium barbadense]|uniref:Uncharacterized protein n=1 Tax=Gossypium barbadense TaxID=3634 RepID=A0A5J5WA04_GOSBA|nr:hypothetical protein ES319_A03G060800v1 [Gossypium barbadense]